MEATDISQVTKDLFFKFQYKNTFEMARFYLYCFQFLKRGGFDLSTIIYSTLKLVKWESLILKTQLEYL